MGDVSVFQSVVMNEASSTNGRNNDNHNIDEHDDDKKRIKIRTVLMQPSLGWINNDPANVHNSACDALAASEYGDTFASLLHFDHRRMMRTTFRHA